MRGMDKLFEKKKNSASELVKELENMHEEYFELYPSYDVAIIEKVPTAIEFLRNYVSQNRPVIIKNAVTYYDAFTKWSNEYLKSKLQNQKITVAVTPNGYADAIYNNDFLEPEERLMTFEEFLDTLEHPKSPVFYIQKQDNNFCNEFTSLSSDIDPHIPWATEALGREPDAINFWMGDKRAVTSMHKDHYENIYCVLRGQKDFILHAPIDAPWIPYQNCRAGRFSEVGESEEPVKIHYSNQMVKWIPVNPLDHQSQEQYPLYKRVRKYHCTVKAGDALYLPSLWFHHVRQSHGCIAVNYWYDMDFNQNYCHFKFLENVGKLIHADHTE